MRLGVAVTEGLEKPGLDRSLELLARPGLGIGDSTAPLASPTGPEWSTATAGQLGIARSAGDLRRNGTASGRRSVVSTWDETVGGRVVVITGASSGIGEATARRLAAEGGRVVLGARRVDKLQGVADEIRSAGGEALAVATDVTRREQVKALVDAAVERFGRIDVLVNNAGIMPLSPLDADKVDEWERTIDVNIKGLLYAISAALPHFRAQGTGHMITVSSVGGHKVLAGAAVYCATKFAVRAIAEGFRQEAGPKLRSTVICPGAVESELIGHISDAAMREAAVRMFQAIEIPAEAIAQAILYTIRQPESVDVNEIIVRPTAQEF
jgi:NADP-dependent 3-hydroxy acid dehydrogenase YdfG